MDKNTVFVKTREGEEAMRQRTRLVQRNLRNILIMVDGHASVADLAKRFGDENAAQAALAELKSGGFIVESAGTLDFTSAQPDDKAEDLPVLTRQVAPPTVPEAAPAAAPPPPPAIEEIELTAPEYESLPPPMPPAAPPSRKSPPASAGPNWMDRIKALLAARAEKPPARTKQVRMQDDLEGQPADDPEPIRRGPRLGWPALAAISIGGLAVLPALTLLFYPYGRHLPDIERNASAMLQDPVKVGDIGFSFLPRPHIALGNVTVGKDAHLTIASVRAVPDFLSLLGDRMVFHELSFVNVAVKDAGLGRLALGTGGRAPVEIRHITLEGLSLTAGDVRLDGISGEVKMTAAGAPEAVLLRNAEGTLKVEMQPKGEAYRIAATGSNWKAPFKPNLTFQALELQGELRSSRLDLSKVDGKAYDGLVEGKASLGWSGKATFAADLELKRMNAAKLLAALGTELSLDGELTARLKLDARADSPGKLPEALRAEGGFEMKRGAAKGFDLGEAVRSTGRGPTRGGETKFEQLSGSLQIGQAECRIGNLRLASGLLLAGGSLGIAGNRQLSGALNVELKSSAATLRMPLAVGGTTKDPMLTPIRR